MIARIKKTGKLIDVVPYGDEFAQLFPEGDFKVYTKDELDFRVDVDWQQVRIQAAIAAMQGMMSSEFYCNIKTRNDAAYSKYREKWGVTQITREAVAHADALIAELKKGGEE